MFFVEGFENKYLVVGFDTNGNLVEVMYKLADSDIANIFHAMKLNQETCGKEGTMPILTDEEADAPDELLTKNPPKTKPDVRGPFIKSREPWCSLQRRCQPAKRRTLRYSPIPGRIWPGPADRYRGARPCAAMPGCPLPRVTRKSPVTRNAA
jgi:hypothetical protein